MGNCNTYNTAIYLRLSRDDGSDKESESIQNQKNFLLKYVVDNSFNLIDIYIDDGWSGTTFNRPDFNRMLSDIESKKINCVITKDLSRLGRDYIMTGHYLERYFPEHGVRYIAVNDGIDTISNNTNNDMTPFRAVFNDMYAKDISKKVRTSLNVKKENGLFIGTVAPYGYKKDSTDRNRLIIDEETACVIKRIYALFIQGEGKKSIARILTNDKVPTPSASKGLTATQKPNYKGIWNASIIDRILTNPTYIGNLTQNRSIKINYKINIKRNLPKEQWISVENTHEPIISKEDFMLVQTLIKQKGYKPKKHRMHLLSGFIKCADCHGTMTFSHDRDGRCYLVCMNSRKDSLLEKCTPHRIREDVVEEKIKEQLKEVAKKYLDKDSIMSAAKQEFNEEDIITPELNMLDNRLHEIFKIISSIYIDKVKGILTEQDFIEMNKKFNEERTDILNRIAQLKSELEFKSSIKKNTTHLKKELERFLSFDEIDRAMFSVLVDKIEIFEGKKIKIYFNFSL